jgi:LCP family protein required for cell wall assembly
MGKHRATPKLSMPARALLVAGLLALVAAIGFFTSIGVHALQAYRSVQREPLASPEEIRQRILEGATTTTRATSTTQAETTVETAPPLLDMDVLAAVILDRNERGPIEPPFSIPEATSPPLPDDMFTTYLLVGQEGYRADAMIYVLLPSDGSAPIIASLPRDLYVMNPCKREYARLNTGLGGCKGVAGGAELLSLMVYDYTGIEVDHFARVDFSGFVNIIDALGGIDICVETPVRDSQSKLDLPAGCSHVGGEMALAWVRSRHTERFVDGEWERVPGASDFARQRHEQEVLFKVAKRLASFSSLSAFSSVAQQVAGAIHLDSHFAFSDAVKLAWRFRGTTQSQVATVRLSTDNYRTPHGALVLAPTATFNADLAKVYPAAAR